jgi:hypothetical protein
MTFHRHSSVLHTNNMSEKMQKYLVPESIITIHREQKRVQVVDGDDYSLPPDFDPREQINDPGGHPNLKMSVFALVAYLLTYAAAFIMHIIVRGFAKKFRNLQEVKQCGYPILQWTGG